MPEPPSPLKPLREEHLRWEQPGWAVNPGAALTARVTLQTSLSGRTRKSESLGSPFGIERPEIHRHPLLEAGMWPHLRVCIVYESEVKCLHRMVGRFR